jgi:pSer/pThr/pTyr-binding forkhead associated (FHA) protein
MFRLQKEVVTLGRDATNDIAINDPEVSRYHLRLIKQGNSYALEDLGSTNGSQVNGAHITTPRILNNGDTIMLGDSIVLSYDLVYAT